MNSARLTRVGDVKPRGRIYPVWLLLVRVCGGSGRPFGLWGSVLLCRYSGVIMKWICGQSMSEVEIEGR